MQQDDKLVITPCWATNEEGFEICPNCLSDDTIGEKYQRQCCSCGYCEEIDGCLLDINTNNYKGYKLQKRIQNYLIYKKIWNIDMTMIHDYRKWTAKYEKYYKNFFKENENLAETLKNTGCPDYAIKINNRIIFLEVKYGTSTQRS